MDSAALPTGESLPRKRRPSSPSRRAAPVQFDRRWWNNLGLNLRYFIKETWLDWLCLLAVGGVTACIYWGAPQAFKLYFTLTDTSISYPFLDPIFSSKCAALVCTIFPLSTFALAQFWMRSFPDFASAVLGFTYATLTGSFIQVVLKKTVGGLRPHFLTVCQPNIPADSTFNKGVGFGGIYYTSDICQGDPTRKLHNAHESFPSGHAQTAFSGLGFLAIYLAARLSIASGGKGYWRMLVVVAPVLLATYLASTLVLGYHHRVGDVLFGILIGCLTAVMGYGMVFRSIWDGRLNAEPYMRGRQKEPDRGEDGVNGSTAA